MAVFFFSVFFLLGLIPAIFFLDRLFAINFANASRRRRGSEDAIWLPRGLADTGAGDETPKSDVKRRPLREGVGWLFSTPPQFEEDLAAYRNLIFYRLSSFATGVVGLLALVYLIFAW